MPRKLLFVLLACAAPAVLAQAIYSWKDASGRTHYSDTPPPDAQTRTIRQTPLPPRPAASDNNAPQTPAERELAFRKRRTEATEAEEKGRKQQLADEQQKQDCTRFRQQLAGLENGEMAVRFNEIGQRVYISDDERATETAQIRQYLERSCK